MHSRIEAITLDRFELGVILGSGSDYEAYAATDLKTGQPVVIKRPNPDYILRRLHYNIDILSEALIEIYESIGNSAPGVCSMVGYTDVSGHDGYFGDTHELDYRVLVFERAKGVPLVADIRDKFKGVPIGLGQNLFALHPPPNWTSTSTVSIQRQIIDVEEAFQAGGHLLLDLRPQNIFFDPAIGNISVIDVGTVPTLGSPAQGAASTSSRSQDIHDFYAEMFRYYLCPDPPPGDVKSYCEPYGMRAIPDFNQQMDAMIDSFSNAEDPPLAEGAVFSLQKIRARAYSSTQGFWNDMQRCLDIVKSWDEVEVRQKDSPNIWQEARSLLRQPYWTKFNFDSTTE